jgi:zinc transport system substrate-binding protein
MIAVLISCYARGDMTRIILVLMCTITALTACGGDSGSSGNGELEVVAAFYPLAWAAEQVGDSNVSVRNLTPPGTEPHDVELSPRDVERIRSADVVLYLGAGFQPAVEDAVEGAEGETLDLLAGQQLLRGDAHEEEAGHEAEEEYAEEEELERDPHVWLDPIRFVRMVERVAGVVGDPAAADELEGKLADLDREFEEGLADCRLRTVVTSHAAFGYLTRRYGLQQVPITGLSPEAEPTPRELEEVVEHVRETEATTIYFETLISPRLAETVARETGAKTGVLDPLEGLSEDDLEGGADYLSVMRENLASLRRGLECR